MKKTIFAFVIGVLCAVGGTVYGVGVFTPTGFIAQSTQDVPAQVVPQTFIGASTQVIAPKVQYAEPVYSKDACAKYPNLCPDDSEARITALEARVRALELKIK